MAELTNPSCRAVRIMESQASDPREAWNLTRVIDLLTTVPKSRDFQEEKCDDFDTDVHSIVRKRREIKLPKRLMEWVKSSFDSDPDTEVDIPFLLNSAMEAMCQHAYGERHCLRDLLEFLHSSVNVMLTIIAITESVPPQNLWKVCLYDCPLGDSGQYAVSSQIMTRCVKVVHLREVTEHDRGGIMVGPSVIFTTIDGETRNAAFDLVSPSYRCNEFVVLGYASEPMVVEIDKVSYASYTHVDLPTSTKTICPHFRLYDVYGSFDMGNCILELPVPLYKLLKNPNPRQNVLDSLHYAADMEILVQHRPDLEGLLAMVIKYIVTGTFFEFSSMHTLETMVRSRAPMRLKEVIKEGQYIRTSYTNRCHGRGYQWEKLYNMMFL